MGTAVAADEEPEDTSKQAFNSVKKKMNKMHIECIEAMKRIGRASANEIAAAVTDNFTKRTTYRRRVQELPEIGRAKVVGTKVCDISNSKVKAYELV